MCLFGRDEECGEIMDLERELWMPEKKDKKR